MPVLQVARSLCLLIIILVLSNALMADCERPEFMTRADIPGLGMAEIQGDRVDLSLYGCARTPDRCVTDDTMFEAASLTKPLVAYIVMRLVDQGRLDLDDPLIDHLPTLPLPTNDPRTARVTARTALAHMSGLRGPDDRTRTFINEPGATFEYDPAGYRLVQRVVEHLEGKPLEAIAQREVFGPLAMDSSSLVYRPEYEGRLATRHRMLGEPIDRARDPSARANAAASLLTTPADYARFLQATLRGEGLTSTSWNAMRTPQIDVPGTNGAVAWGLGWGLEPERGTFFHWGHDGAAKAFTIGDPSTNHAIVYFANGFYGMAIAGEIAERVIPGDSPAVEWLDYAAWNDPERLVRRDTVRAFVDGNADRGMETFERAARDHPNLDMDAVARFVAWILDSRSKHEGHARLLAWQRERQPDSLPLMLEHARVLQAAGDDPGALDALRDAMPLAEGETVTRLANRIQWIDDRRASTAPSRGASPALDTLTGQYGPRRVTNESGSLWYQRADGPRYQLIWMCGTTFALAGLDDFRLRFELEHGRATAAVGLYEDGRTDTSPRSP